MWSAGDEERTTVVDVIQSVDRLDSKGGKLPEGSFCRTREGWRQTKRPPWTTPSTSGRAGGPRPAWSTPYTPDMPELPEVETTTRELKPLVQGTTRATEYERALAENRRWAAQFDRSALPGVPGRKLAVLACMDVRLTVEDILAIRTGDAHIIRNAGGLATDDALRSLIISQQLLGTEEVIVIGHTGCGMLTFRDDELLASSPSGPALTSTSPSMPLRTLRSTFERRWNE